MELFKLCWIAMATMTISTSVLAFVPTRALPFPVRHRPVAPTRAPPLMLFMDEVKLREDALQWAKETSRLKRLPGVIALYDIDMKCSFVGVFDDVSFATAALAKKHGVNVCCALRVEEFPKEILEEDFGVKMMDSLAELWIQEATEQNGGTVPIGNVEEGWRDYDPNQDPYLAGLFGANGMMLEEGDAAMASRGVDTLEEKTQLRKERMKNELDEAMARGDERAATEFMRRLNIMSDDDTVDGTYTE